jgi:hypothetical protein
VSGGETTMEEWVHYMSGLHGQAATEVIEFASQNVKHLDGDITGELGFSIQPSRRSWDMVVRVNEACRINRYSEAAKLEVISGLVGRELGLAFTKYSCPVKPRDLIDRGVKAYANALESLQRNQLTGLMWGLVSYCKGKIDEDNVANVCLDFAEFLAMSDVIKDKDLVVAFFKALIGADSQVGPKEEKVRNAIISNPKMVAILNQFNKHTNKKTFINRIAERPELQNIMKKIAWGSTDESAKIKKDKK